jgi:chemotaxis response regulator CheB
MPIGLAPPLQLRQWSLMRILAVNLPRFLGGVISDLVSLRPGLDIVGEAGADDMLPAVARLRPDTVIIGGEAEDGDEAATLLEGTYPNLRVVLIDGDGRTARLHEPGGATFKVAEISADALLQMLSSKH